MRQNILVILSIILLTTAGLLFYLNHVGQKNSSNKQQSDIEVTNKKDAREVVWGQLSSNQKEQIDGTWRNGKISKITFNAGMGMVEDKSYEGKEVYLIEFSTKSDASSQNIVVYADLNTSKYIGYGFTD